LSTSTTTPLAYSKKQLVVLLGDMSEQTINRRIADGTIRAVRIGRRVLIPATEVERLLSGEAA
jgi:excisionase family DNA binding protein